MVVVGTSRATEKGSTKTIAKKPVTSKSKEMVPSAHEVAETTGMPLAGVALKRPPVNQDGSGKNRDQISESGNEEEEE